MKSTKVVKIISVVFLFFVILFGPMYLIENNIESAVFAMFYSGFTWFSAVLLIGLFLILISMLFEALNVTFKFSSMLETIFLLSALMIVAFSYEFYTNVYHSKCSLYLLSYVVITLCILFVLKNVSVFFEHHQLTVSDIVEIGIFVALAVVLDMSFFKIRVGANGGSISLAMLPLFLVSIRKGFFKGFVASGIIFGLITCLTDNYGIITYPFDYLLGFGSIAIIGLFKKQIFPESNRMTVRGLIFLIVGYWLAIIGRTAAATLSGMLIYKLNFVSSLVYQLTYLGPSSGIVFAAVLIFYKPLLIVNKRFAFANR